MRKACESIVQKRGLLKELWYDLCVSHHSELKSDNKDKMMKENRLVTKLVFLVLYVLLIGLFFYCMSNILINCIDNIVHGFDMRKQNDGRWSVPETAWHLRYLISPRTVLHSGYLYYLRSFLLGITGIIMLVCSYKAWISYSLRDINKEQYGSSRWTTLKELHEQYIRVPMKPTTEHNEKRYTNYYKGRCGTIVSKYKDQLFLDEQLSNNMYQGATRSGKGEMYVFPLIDLISRAFKKKDRASIITTDPKIELYKSSKAALEKRGYDVHLLNIDNPVFSAGYNSLHYATQLYKAGDINKCQMSVKSFCYQTMASQSGESKGDSKMWDNAATSLFTALCYAYMTDNVERDRILNEKRKASFEFCRNLFDEKSDKEKRVYIEYEWKQKRESIKKGIEKARQNGEDEYKVFVDKNIAIPDSESFSEVCYFEKFIHPFAVIHFLNTLKAESSPNNKGKENKDMLQEYFEERGKRGSGDFAYAMYSVTKSGSSRTLGSVYIVMQTALNTFMLEAFQKMTARQTIDFEKVGFGDRPQAIFIGIPSEDRSNYFIATAFINQIYQYLFQRAKMNKGKLDRNVMMILDEFGNLPMIENFASMVTVGLGIGIAFHIFVQSYAQVDGIYGDEAEIIKDNCAYHIYIKSSSTETSEAFQKFLANKTVIDVSRQGSRWTLNKSYNENARELPLMNEGKLRMELKEGESIVYRIMKRTDLHGNPIANYPIINEYGKLNILDFFHVLKIFTKNLVGIGGQDELELETIEGAFIIEKSKALQSYEKIKNIKTTWKKAKFMQMRRKGTSFLYRYEYATDSFPNPTGIDLYKMEGVPNLKNLDMNDYLENNKSIVHHAEDYISGKLDKEKEMLDKGNYPEASQSQADIGYEQDEKVDLCVNEYKDRQQHLRENVFGGKGGRN